MDISAFDPVGAAQDGAWMELRNPFTGDFIKGTRLKVMGYDADAVVAVERDNARSIIERLRNDGGDPLKDREDLAINRAIAAVVDWENFGWGNDSEKFSKELLSKVLRGKGQWIVTQVEEFGTKRANFMPASLKS